MNKRIAKKVFKNACIIWNEVCCQRDIDNNINYYRYRKVFKILNNKEMKDISDKVYEYFQRLQDDKGN